MNFEFSEEQEMLHNQARKFLTENSSCDVAREVLEGDDAHNAELWRKIADLGWLGTAIPEEYGGLGLGHLELCVIAEELGHSLAPVPFASTVYLAAEAINISGNEDQKRHWLAKIAAGETIATLALAERPGPLLEKDLSTKFSGGKLSGVKTAVTDGGIADIAIVAASSAEGTGLYLVELDGPGVVREPLQCVDPTRPQSRLTFADAPAQLLGLENDAWNIVELVFDRAAVLLAFEQVGGAQASLEMAKAYAMERYAFGRAIASYQAIKHKLADVYTATELARSNAYFGAWALSTGAAELPVAAATARVAGIQAFYLASKENIQTHGGMGFTWAFDCHLYYRRSKHLALILGSERLWKDKLITRINRRNAA